MSDQSPPTSSDDLAELQRRLDREITLRRRLMRIAQDLTSTLDHDEVVRSIIADAVDLIGTETASVLEVDEESGDLVISFVAGGIAEQVTSMRVPAGQGIGGWVVRTGQTALVNEPENDERFYTDIDESTGFETASMLAVPLKRGDRTIGVLELINKTPGFDADDQELAEGFAALAAIALENAATYAKLADAVVTARMSYRR